MMAKGWHSNTNEGREGDLLGRGREDDNDDGNDGGRTDLKNLTGNLPKGKTASIPPRFRYVVLTHLHSYY